MSIYKKRVSLGNFLKKGEDFKADDIIEIANEGVESEGKFGMQDIFLVKLADGKEGNIPFNNTSINCMIDAFGEDSKNWIGKKVKVWIMLTNIQGKMRKVAYFTHPDAVLNDESGVFELPGKGPKEKEDIPIIEENKPAGGTTGGEEIDAKDIPF